MDFDSISILHKKDPTVLALRKEWLPLAVSFLYRTFKQHHVVLISQSVFQEQLDTYLDYINTTLPDDGQFRQSSKYYLDRWSREDDLIRVRSRDEGYVVQLSPHGERLIGWFQELQNRGTVGTESRLRNILALLDETVMSSTEDIEKRLRQLVDRRDAIDAEIERIQTSGQVEGLSDLQIRERLDHISGMASQLLRDFSLVEERFREMARTIQQAQLNPELRRGDILETALDADEQLENSDEGQSFRAFYELLTHPEQREKFEILIHEIFATPRLSDFAYENLILQRLISHLMDASERVNYSNQRLAEHLRRVVDFQNVTESRRVQALARDIKHMVSQFDDISLTNISRMRIFTTLEGDPAVELPLERPLFDPPIQVNQTTRPESAPMLLDAEALMPMFNIFYVDLLVLTDNIKRMLMSRSETTLLEVMTSYPITKGISEVIAYLQIAATTPEHQIETSRHDEINISTNTGQPIGLLVPHIIFRRAQPNGARS